jgi:hypothetical protein
VARKIYPKMLKYRNPESRSQNSEFRILKFKGNLMGEIKSTLDLIMEKTKNLSMSPEEKAEIKGQEWLKKARGWIQKFQDDLIDLDKIKRELLDRDLPAGWEKRLKMELIDGLDPEGDNQKRWQLIRELLTISSEPFLRVLEAYIQQVNQAKAVHLELLKNDLLVQGFSGSALIPNLDSEPSWRGFLDQENKTCREKWRALINN